MCEITLCVNNKFTRAGRGNLIERLEHLYIYICVLLRWSLNWFTDTIVQRAPRRLAKIRIKIDCKSNRDATARLWYVALVGTHMRICGTH